MRVQRRSAVQGDAKISMLSCRTRQCRHYSLFTQHRIKSRPLSVRESTEHHGGEPAVHRQTPLHLRRQAGLKDVWVKSLFPHEMAQYPIVALFKKELGRNGTKGFGFAVMQFIHQMSTTC